MTNRVDMRFYAELRDLLPADRESGLVARTFDVAGSVKDMIEACGVPHTEVDVILVDGEAVDFAYRVRDRDRISVYPPFIDLAVDPAWRLSPAPLPEPRFVVDGHLSKLARYLRLLGVDAECDVVWSDPELVSISTTADRTLLTRDVGLLMHGALVRGYLVRATDPKEQLVEVVARFGISAVMDPYTRCMACNGSLSSVSKGEVEHRLKPGTRSHYDDFSRCTDCGRIYWEGAHHAGLQELVDLARETPVRVRR